MNINKKLNEYKSILDFNNEYYKKDFKSNLKFIEGAVFRLRKEKMNEEEIVAFLQDAINIHKEIYSN